MAFGAITSFFKTRTVTVNVERKDYFQFDINMAADSVALGPGDKDDVVEYREYERDGGRIIFYRIYLDNLEKGEKGYSMEEYERQRGKYGVILLETNLKGKVRKRYMPHTRAGGR